MRKLWDKFVTLLYKIGQDKWYHFIAGALFAACIYIIFGWRWSPIVAAFAAGLAKEIFDIVTTKVYDWKDLVATVAGGFVVQIFVWISMLL